MSVHDDERFRSRRDHRQAALDAQYMAGGMVTHADDNGGTPDWEQVRYWQREAQIEALLALSAGDA